MSDDGTVPWSALLAETRARLEAAGIDTAAVDARRMVEEAAGVEPGEFAATLEEPATQRGVARFDAMVDRRLGGEPLQYVLGRWSFRTLDLAVDRRVLVPRPETEVVAGLAIAEVQALEEARPGDVVVVDLGTGSGAMALSIAVECPRARVVATDRSADAVAVARANLAGIGRDATRVSLHQGSWFEALPGDLLGRVDVLVANPPYVADHEDLPEVVADWEPTMALRSGPKGTEALDEIVDGADRWLAPSASVVLEMAPHQTEHVAARWTDRGFATVVQRDLAGRDRAVVARRSR